MDTSPEALGWTLHFTSRTAAPGVPPIPHVYREYVWACQRLGTTHADGVLVGWEIKCRPERATFVGCGVEHVVPPRPAATELYVTTVNRKPLWLTELLLRYIKGEQTAHAVMTRLDKAVAAGTNASSWEEIHTILGDYRFEKLRWTRHTEMFRRQRAWLDALPWGGTAIEKSWIAAVTAETLVDHTIERANKALLTHLHATLGKVL